MSLSNNLKKQVNSYLRNFVDLTDRDIKKREELNEVSDQKSYRNPDSPYLVGIINDVHQYHKFFVKAALEMKISFDVIDIHRNDWWDKLRAEDYDGFLIWPNGMRESLKSAYDSRVKMIVDYLKKPVYPDYLSIWLYENKIRALDWLRVNEFPTIPTSVYYSKEQAMEHLKTNQLPVVFKTNLGASGKGVYIVKSESEYRKRVQQCFSVGLKSYGVCPYSESRGYAYIQKFIPGMEEWRMVRIGDAYFGHRKMADENSGKHSGTLLKGWEKPSEELLDILYEVTERGGFRSMNVDMFRDHEGNIYINELHAVWGQSTEHLMIIDNVPGRYIRDNGKWKFEAGSFVKGHSAIARIEYFLKQIGKSEKQLS